jgi:F-type H+-transporting ATPase subunit gamma
MTRRRELERHRASLAEIGEIMGSMRTLAYLETRKLTRFMAAQQAVVDSIETVAADFLSFHPDTLSEDAGLKTVYLLFGSERGFCGDFNRVLVAQFDAATHDRADCLIATGHKLHLLLERHPAKPLLLDGPSVAEDVPVVLQAIVEALDGVRARLGAFRLVCMFQSAQGVQSERLLPPFTAHRKTPMPLTEPPLLNVDPHSFLLDLTEHYLLAALNRILYASLLLENQQRMAHLDGAVRHVDDATLDLARRCRSLRQEEIVEEIEVILLSAASLDPAERSA